MAARGEADRWWANPGERIFDVAMEGVAVLDGYDIAVAAGGSFAAVTETAVVSVTDGQLDIEFTGVLKVALISAIAVVGVGP